MGTDKFGNTKRQGYLSWDEYFMSIALLSAQRSKDPNTQVGACLINMDKKIIGIGYNGMPTGCSDDDLPWAREATNVLDTKYMYVCHAELNCILNKNSNDSKNSTMYITLFPCNECAKLIIQAGVKRIIYLSDKYDQTPPNIASKRLLDMAFIKYTKFETSRKQIVINF
ncbi:deoxycytidylate deaminase-like isoform X2 [Gordionus sp. m RMFG-2023]